MTIGNGGSVALWDPTDPDRPRVAGPPLEDPVTLFSAAMSLDGSLIAIANHDSTISLWDVRDPSRPRQIGEPLPGIAERGQYGPADAMAFSPDGTRLAVASRSVILWDITNPAQPRQIGEPAPAHDGAVTSIVLTPDELTFATDGFDHRVILWDASDPSGPRQVGAP